MGVPLISLPLVRSGGVAGPEASFPNLTKVSEASGAGAAWKRCHLHLRSDSPQFESRICHHKVRGPEPVTGPSHCLSFLLKRESEFTEIS